MENIIAKNISEFQKDLLATQERIFEEALRTTVIPPIKGEITKGKIKWRGVRIAQQKVMFDTYIWLEQRGVQVSPKIHINFIDQTKKQK